MKPITKTRLAIAITAALSSGAALATTDPGPGTAQPGYENIRQIGGGHSATIVRYGEDSGVLIKQRGDGGHSALVTQGVDAGRGVLTTIRQDGDFATNTAVVDQTPGNARHQSTVEVNQNGAGNEATVDAGRVSKAGTDTLTINQGQTGTSAYNKAKIATSKSQNITATIDQGGALNEATATFLSGSDNNTVTLTQHDDSASNKIKVSAEVATNASVIVKQGADSARNEVDVLLRSDDGANTEVLQSAGQGNQARVQHIESVRVGVGSIKSSIEQTGSSNYAAFRSKNNEGAHGGKVTQNGHGNTSRVIIEDTTISYQSLVEQQANNSEANVVIRSGTHAGGFIKQTGGNGHLGRVVIESSEEFAGFIVQSGGDGNAAAINVSNATGRASLDDAVITQSGDAHNARIRYNYTDKVKTAVAQTGDAHIASVKVNGGSVGTEILINQGQSQPDSYRAIAEVKAQKDKAGATFRVTQNGDLNRAVLVGTNLESSAAGSRAVVTQAGGRKNRADAHLQDLTAVGDIDIAQSGADLSKAKAFAQINASTGTIQIRQAQDGAEATAKLLNGSGDRAPFQATQIDIDQNGNGDDNVARVVFDNSTLYADVRQEGNGQVADVEVTDVKDMGNPRQALNVLGVSMLRQTEVDQSGSSNEATLRMTNVTGSLVRVEQSGDNNSADLAITESTGVNLYTTQSGNDSRISLEMDNTNLKTRQQKIVLEQIDGIGHTMDLSLTDSDLKDTFVTQSGGSSNLTAALVYDNVERLETNLMQQGNGHQATINATDGERSSAFIDQRGPLGHEATIELNNAERSAATIIQTGFMNTATLTLTDVVNSSGKITQGGYGNTLDVTITSDNVTFDSNSDSGPQVNQSDCYGCTASLNL